LGLFFHPFYPERLRQDRKVPALSFPGTGKPETAAFLSDFSDTSPSPPSFARFGSPSPPHHASKQALRQMILYQQEPVVSGVLD
jgi:hypothetical protein